MNPPVIGLHDLKKYFKEVKAVDAVTLAINGGEIFGLLGPNGAGKTTILNILCALLKPTSGTAAVCGHDVRREKDAVRRSIGIVFQDPSLDDQLTAFENLDLDGRLYHIDRGTRKETLAMEEGARYMFLSQPVRFIAAEDSRLSAIECIKMELGEPDKKGRRKPIPVEGSNFILEADTAVLALGYWPDPIIMNTTPNFKTDKWGLITADVKTGKTSRSEIFAGGDDVTGPSLVVTAMVAGRNAAREIDRFLRN